MAEPNPDPRPDTSRISVGEAALMPPLVHWLRSTRRIREDTRLYTEFRWLGRRIDLVSWTASNRLSAYELKLAHITRVVEQAVYNRVAFERSYVVTSAMPKADNLAMATAHGIGLILVRDGTCSLLASSPFVRTEMNLRKRLTDRLREARQSHV